MKCTQILVHNWRHRTRISACFADRLNHSLVSSVAQASFARNDVPYAGAGTLLHIFSSPSASSLQCHFYCQKYYIIDNYYCVFIKFMCWLFEKH